MATTIPTLVTYEEWLQMPEVQDGIEEVVNGEIRIMPPPKWQHAQVVENFREVLRNQTDPREVLVMAAQFGLIIRRDPLTSRQPDVAVFRKQSVIEQDGYIHSAPELIVEVLSPANTRRERAEKLEDYASLGVPEVWVASPEARTIEVLLREGSKLRTSQVLLQGELRPKLFPEVRVDVASVWPD